MYRINMWGIFTKICLLLLQYSSLNFINNIKIKEEDLMIYLYAKDSFIGIWIGLYFCAWDYTKINFLLFRERNFWINIVPYFLFLRFYEILAWYQDFTWCCCYNWFFFRKNAMVGLKTFYMYFYCLEFNDLI